MKLKSYRFEKLGESLPWSNVTPAGIAIAFLLFAVGMTSWTSASLTYVNTNQSDWSPTIPIALILALFGLYRYARPSFKKILRNLQPTYPSESSATVLEFFKTRFLLKKPFACLARSVTAIILIACWLPTAAFAVTYTSIANGNWNSGTTWAGGTTPGSTINAADIVNIKHIVTYNLPNDLIINGTVNINNGTFRTALMGDGMNRCVFILSGGDWNMCNAQMFLPIFSCGYGCSGGANLSGNFRNEGGTISIYNSTVEIAQNWEDASSGT